MAEKLPVRVSGSDMKCGICLEQLREPKLLPCLHSFCRECIKAYIKSLGNEREFPCPLCREAVPTPENMADGLEDNIYVLAEESDVSQCQATDCDVCEEHKASSTCIECKQHYCSHCSKMHTKQTFAKEHHIVSVDQDPAKGKTIRSKVYCAKHTSQELSCYCEECQEVICFKCNMIEHKHHNSKEIDVISPEKRKEVLSVIDDIEGSVVPCISVYIDGLQRQQRKYGANKSEQRKRIEDHVVKVKQRLDKEAAAMMRTLETDLDEKGAVLQREIESTEKALSRNRETRQSIRQMVALAGDSEWLMKYKGVKGRLVAQLTSKQISFDTTEYLFTSNDKYHQQIGSLKKTEDFTLPMKATFKGRLQIVLSDTPRAVCAGGDNAVWVASRNTVVLYRIDGQVIRTCTIDIGDNVYGITADKSGQIFIACENSVKRDIKGNRLDTCLRLQNKPSCLTCTRDEKLAVCVGGTKDIIKYDLKPSGRGFEKDSKLSIDVIPYKIACNKDNNLVVAVQGSNDVMVLDGTGKVQVVLKGDNMRSGGLACSGDGYILVADQHKHLVMLYSMEGYAVQTLVPPMDNGLREPIDISLDASGRNLWILYSDGQISLYEILRDTGMR